MVLFWLYDIPTPCPARGAAPAGARGRARAKWWGFPGLAREQTGCAVLTAGRGCTVGENPLKGKIDFGGSFEEEQAWKDFYLEVARDCARVGLRPEPALEAWRAGLGHSGYAVWGQVIPGSGRFLSEEHKGLLLALLPKDAVLVPDREEVTWRVGGEGTPYYSGEVQLLHRFGLLTITDRSPKGLAHMALSEKGRQWAAELTQAQG